MKKIAIVFLHVGYWFLYILLLMLFVKGVPGPMSRQLVSVDTWIRWFLYNPISTMVIVPGAIAFYTSYTFLFNRFLIRKRIPALFLTGIAVCLASGLIGWGLLFIRIPGYRWSGYPIFLGMTTVMSILALIHATIGLVLRGFIVSYRDITIKERLGKKNTEMELALIKSQINPHFLFNTINNIDVLIEKDPARASLYLNKLSDIMRFILYETKSEKIPLEKELAYIEKYLDLQRIRTSNREYVQYSVEGDTSGKMIDPMLFMPFIENAFKHSENKKKEQAIDIRVKVAKDTIIFDCRNKYSAAAATTPSTATTAGERPDHSGLGNGLIRKRLTLLYPGTHTLDISTEDDIYRAQLTLIHVD